MRIGDDRQRLYLDHDRLVAHRAVPSSTAATRAMASPTWRIVGVGEDWPVRFGGAELVEGDVDAEHHSVYAGMARAGGRGMARMRACGTVERRTAPCSMPAIRRSVTYSSRPVATARAWSLGTERPTEAPARAAVSPSAMAGHLHA